MWRKIRWMLSFLLLLATGVIGGYNAVNEWRSGGTLLQRSVTIAVGLYALFGLAAAAAMLRRSTWSFGLAIAWGACTTYAATVAVIAFGGEGVTVSAAAGAAVGALLIAALVAWGARLPWPERSRTSDAATPA